MIKVQKFTEYDISVDEVLENYLEKYHIKHNQIISITYSSYNNTDRILLVYEEKE